MLPKASKFHKPIYYSDYVHKTLPSIAVLSEASKFPVSPMILLEDSEAFLQEEEEEIPLQKPKRKLIRKNIIAEDEEEPKKSKRTRSLINYNMSEEELGVDQKLYEIKEILGLQKASNSAEVQYLISWKGYKNTTWEPEKNLVGIDCPALINKFLKKNKKYL